MNNGNYSLLVDFPTWYSRLENQSTATLGDAIQYFAQCLKTIVPECEYTVINNAYPAVKLPWHDENSGNDYFPAIIFYANKTELLSNSLNLNSSVYVGVSNGIEMIGEDKGYARYLPGVGNSCGNSLFSNGSIRIAAIKFGVKISKNDKFINLGFCLTSSNSITSAVFNTSGCTGRPYIITNRIDIRDGILGKCVIGINMYSDGYVNMFHRSTDNKIQAISVKSGSGTIWNSMVNLQAVIIGPYKVDGFYYTNAEIYTLLQNIQSWDNHYNEIDGVNHKALTLNDKQFSVFVKYYNFATLCYEEE